MKNKFIICGTLGWCMEIIFTALHSFKKREFTLIGRTSIWMFPIYGAACLLTPVCRLLKGKNPLLRGGVYTCCIFFGEFLSGSFPEKAPCVSLGLQQSKIQFKGHHPI